MTLRVVPEGLTAASAAVGSVAAWIDGAAPCAGVRKVARMSRSHAHIKSPGVCRQMSERTAPGRAAWRRCPHGRCTMEFRCGGLCTDAAAPFPSPQKQKGVRRALAGA